MRLVKFLLLVCEVLPHCLSLLKRWLDLVIVFRFFGALGINRCRNILEVVFAKVLIILINSTCITIRFL